MILYSYGGIQYRLKDFLIVLGCILLSKSLYYETYGSNLLLIILLGLLIITVKPLKLQFNKKIIFYILFFISLIIVNTETQVDTATVLIVRLCIAAYVVHLLDFKKFSIIYIRIILFLCLTSLAYLFIIYFKIYSFLPDFIGLDGRSLKNFLFFGVSNNNMIHNVYRNSGLWWEPGAFQIFINIAFIFAIANKMMTTKLYIILGVTIISTLSTTGVLVYILLSTIYWKDVMKTSGKRVLHILFLLLTIGIVIVIAIPFLLIKFGGGNLGEASLSFLSRYYDFIISINLFSDNLLLGYGFGSQNAIPYGKELLGSDRYELINPTGSDGLSMFVAQCGIFSVILLYPFLYPKYCLRQGILNRTLIMVCLLVMFNTENFTFILIFTLLSFYGIVGHKRLCQPVHTTKR